MNRSSRAGASDKARCSSSSENAHAMVGVERARRRTRHPSANQFRRTPHETTALHGEDGVQAVGAIVTVDEGHTRDSHQSRHSGGGPSDMDASAFETSQEWEQRQEDVGDEEHISLEESTGYDADSSGSSFNTISLSPSVRGSPAAGSIASGEHSFSPPLQPHEQAILPHGRGTKPSFSPNTLGSRSREHSSSNQEGGGYLAMPTITGDGQLVEGRWGEETGYRTTGVNLLQWRQAVQRALAHGVLVYDEFACTETEAPGLRPWPMRKWAGESEESDEKARDTAD